jgi:S-DNA-T family DNA segregation ATPase FtsK/SpoIIIE
MNSKILTKVNYFIKNRLMELLGLMLVFISIFLLTSIVSYSPSDPNFIYSPENTEIKNIGGFYGSVISDFLLQSLGLISFFLVFNFFCWGLMIIIKKKISSFVTKIFFTLVYIILGTTVLNTFFNDSFWLIDNGNGGFVGRKIKENIYYFTPLIENQYVIYSFGLLEIVNNIQRLSMKPNEIIIILLLP